MTSAETRFKLVVCALVRMGRHPSPIRIMGSLDRERRELNEDEIRWLREDLGVQVMSDCQLFCCKQGGDFLMGCTPVETKS